MRGCGAAGNYRLASELAKIRSEAIEIDLEERRATVLAEATGKSNRHARCDFANWKTRMTVLHRPNRRTTSSRKGMEKVIHDYYSVLFDSHVHLPHHHPRDDGYEVPKVLPSKVRHAITSAKNGTAPGPDRIRSEQLKSLPPVIINTLARLFTLCLLECKVPKQWKTSKTVLLYKKGDPHDIGSYRSIYLLSAVYKLFARVFLNRIERILDEEQPCEQAGFRTEPDELSKLSCRDSIARILLETSGPWSIVYYRPDMNCVFVGRDIFGRFSLVFALHDGDIIISELAEGSAPLVWNEVPYAQVTCIDTTNKSAIIYSYLATYPENVLEPWTNLFNSFSLEHEPIKDDLITVSRATEWPSCNVVEQFLERLVAATSAMLPNDKESTAVAFSGGVDSLLIAVALHLAYFPEGNIDLVNVAFIRDPKYRSVVTDRKRAIAGYTFLRTKYPTRNWRLILADVTQDEMEKNRSKNIVKAAAPALSVMDESLACVLWFALRGTGKDYDNGEAARSKARVYFVGSGADELLAGYARHRTRFERDGPDSIPEECEAELRRLGCRNCGRDARIAVSLEKELRAPFLNDDFVTWVNTLPMRLKCDLKLPRGKGEKLIVRKVLAEVGAPHESPKQAMQFGSGFVKMQNDKTLKGDDVSSILVGLQDHKSLEN